MTAPSDPPGAPPETGTTGASSGGSGAALTGQFFRYPWAAPFLLAWTVGIIDASTFARLGVFTSNQAGNLVIVATSLPTEPQAAALSALSLAGAAVGLLGGVWLRARFAAESGMRVVAPLILATALLAISVVVDLLNMTVALIALVSAGLACLASALLLVPAVGVWLTANTGQYLSAVSGFLGPRAPGGGLWTGIPPVARRAATLIAGFLFGALCVGSGLLPERVIPLGMIPAVVAIAFGLADLRRRHRPPEATRPQT